METERPKESIEAELHRDSEAVEGGIEAGLCRDREAPGVGHRDNTGLEIEGQRCIELQRG